MAQCGGSVLPRRDDPLLLHFQEFPDSLYGTGGTAFIVIVDVLQDCVSFMTRLVQELCEVGKWRMFCGLTSLAVGIVSRQPFGIN